MIGSISFSAASALPEMGMSPVSGIPKQVPDAAATSDFSSVLKSFASDAAQSVRQGEAAALAGIQGNLPLQTVVDQVLAAERTLQASLAVRDKLVTSYLEISRMQI